MVVGEVAGAVTADGGEAAACNDGKVDVLFCGSNLRRTLMVKLVNLYIQLF